MPGEPDLPKNEEHEVQLHSLKIGRSFLRRLEKHVLARKHMTDGDLNKQAWVLEAIQDRLSRDKAAGLANIAKGKEAFLTLKLDKSTHDAVGAQVNILKQVNRTYSSKKWILEAIEEKFEKEEEQVRTWYQQLQAIASK